MEAPEFVEVNNFLPSGPVHAATESYMLSPQEQAEEAVYNELMAGVTISDDNQMLESFAVKPAPARLPERPDVVLIESKDHSAEHGQMAAFQSVRERLAERSRAQQEAGMESEAELEAEALAEAEARESGIFKNAWNGIKKAGAKAVNAGINSLKNSANKFMDKIFGNAKKAKAKAAKKVNKKIKKAKAKGKASGKNDMPKIFGGAYKKVNGMYKKKDVEKLTKAFNNNHSKKSSTNIGERAVDTSVAADNIGIKALSAAQGMDDRTGRWKAPPTYHKGLPFPAAPRSSPSDRYASQKAGILTEEDLPNI